MPEEETKKENNYSNLPLVTIITVVFNAVDLIENTIKSVLEQTYKNIEYIIIDGGSTDGTIEIIKKYDNQIDRWVSERDKGVYDGMNKGIKKASGKWINFMNAGDMFCKNSTIEEVFDKIDYNTDLVYGSAVEIVGDNKLKHSEASDILENLWKGAQFGHESLFVKSDIIKNIPFNLNYKVAADYDFIMNCFYGGRKFQKVDVNVLLFTLPGFSRDHWIRASWEGWVIAKKYEKKEKVNLYYLSNFLLSLIVKTVKHLLPDEVYLRLKKVLFKD